MFPDRPEGFPVAGRLSLAGRSDRDVEARYGPSVAGGQLHVGVALDGQRGRCLNTLSADRHGGLGPVVDRLGGAPEHASEGVHGEHLGW